MKYRDNLPQLAGGMFVTDGGVETTLIFKEGIDLPDFAAFDLLKRDGGPETIERYFRQYAEIAKRHRAGLILESVTWRASADWGDRLGYSKSELAAANRRAIRLLEGIRDEVEAAGLPAVISGCVGPRGDGYQPTRQMSAGEALEYHRTQIAVLAGTSADMIGALTLNYVEEAIGITMAARIAGMPVAIAFTVETDGRLPDGQPLRDAIAEVDAGTAAYPAYYMVNCAHPTHFAHVFAEGGPWLSRIRGIRANASRLSHAELDEAPVLDDGDPEQLGREYADLARRLPELRVVGGCCGTDERHVEKVATACERLLSGAGGGTEEIPLPMA